MRKAVESVAVKSFWVAALLACSSAGPGSPTGAGGTGPAAGGAGGGAAGTGGATGICEASFPGPIGAACNDVSNRGPCVDGTDMPCFNTCGPLKSGIKNCVCAAGMWSCPTCYYDPDPAKSYACYKRPATPTPCPPDPTDTSGMMLIKSGDPCVQPTCMACGSEVANTYRDTSNSNKMGYCVCSSSDPAAPGKWSCASAKEWPPACLTDR